MSLIRDPDTYDRFDRIILVHTVRQVAELAYNDLIERDLPNHELLGEMVREKLVYWPSVTREPFRNQGRLTDLLRSGKLCSDVGLPPLDPKVDRAMICGSSAMLRELKTLLEERGFAEGSTSRPGDFVIERAFVDQ
jgi:ferredoxin--NADP+ reductase